MKTALRTSALALSLAVAALELAGCSAADEAVSNVTGGGGSSFDGVYTTILSKNCNGCHGASAPGYNPGETESTLDFSSADKAYTSLLGKAAGLTGNNAACNDVAFVVPGDAAKSLLMASIDRATRTAFVSGGCNKDSVSAMESRGGTLTAAQVEGVRAWINGGAKR